MSFWSEETIDVVNQCRPVNERDGRQRSSSEVFNCRGRAVQPILANLLDFAQFSPDCGYPDKRDDSIFLRDLEGGVILKGVELGCRRVWRHSSSLQPLHETNDFSQGPRTYPRR